MQTLHHSVVLKPGLSRKAKLSLFKPIFILILIYGHECWIITKKVRSQMQASEMRFWRKKKHRNTAIRESLDIELQVFRIKNVSLDGLAM